MQLERYFFQASALVLKNDDGHQVASTIFQRTLKHQIDDAFVSVVPDIMRWRRFDFRKVDRTDECLIRIKHQKIDKHDKPTEHPLYKNVNRLVP